LKNTLTSDLANNNYRPKYQSVAYAHIDIHVVLTALAVLLLQQTTNFSKSGVFGKLDYR